MDHKGFMDSMMESMVAADEQVKAINEAKKNEGINVEDIDYTFSIPMITGRVFRNDVRNVDWGELATPINKAKFEANEDYVRAVVNNILLADFSKPEAHEMVEGYDEQITAIFKNFGIDPGYEEFFKNTNLEPHVKLLGKCFDVLTLLKTMMQKIEAHEVAVQLLDITTSFNDVAKLNDITEMDNSTNGLISEDRINYGGIPDDHDVSGLLEE